MEKYDQSFYEPDGPVPPKGENESDKLSSNQDGVYALGKVHTRSILSVRSFPSVTFEAVSMLV